MSVRSRLGWVALGASLTWLAAGCAQRSVAGSPGLNAPSAAGLTVVGTGEATAAPDIARTQIGVEVRADTVAEATAQSNQRMAAILAALKALGIADEDLRTHGFSISFEHLPVPPPGPLPQREVAPSEPAPRGAPDAPADRDEPGVRGVYRASNMLEVTIRDLDKTGQVLQAATEAGANNVWGLTFELEDPTPLLAEARAQAVEHAKQSAEALARLSGVKLGPIVAISEGGGGGPRPSPAFEMRAAMDAAKHVPVERGEVRVSLQVQIVYALPES